MRLVWHDRLTTQCQEAFGQQMPAKAEARRESLLQQSEKTVAVIHGRRLLGLKPTDGFDQSRLKQRTQHFLSRELKCEVFRETVSFAFERLIENASQHAVEAGEVGIETERECVEMVAQQRGPGKLVPVGQRARSRPNCACKQAAYLGWARIAA